MLKELRQAITASGRNYITTFTAPTSYWYLRHFDIKNMSEQVDWINLMSYDLHGVWDGDNPIGKHILSHTNLTEIDLALDLVSDPDQGTSIRNALLIDNSSGALTLRHPKLSWA